MAAQGSDFCITSVRHYLTARAQAGDLAARFVAVIGQTHTIGGLVPAEASAHNTRDLAGLRLAGQPDNGLVQSFQAGLERVGLSRCELIESDSPAETVARGEADVIPATVDTVRRNERQSGLTLRAIPVGLDVYMSGLVAGDHVSSEACLTLRDAIAQALKEQKDNPGDGLSHLLARYPEVDPDDALDGWSAVQPSIFSNGPVGMMTAAGWQDALSQTSSSHGLPHISPLSAYRPDFCAD